MAVDDGGAPLEACGAAATFVRQTLSAIEAVRDEVLADDMTRQVKTGLSDEVGIYLDYDPERAVAGKSA